MGVKHSACSWHTGITACLNVTWCLDLKHHKGGLNAKFCRLMTWPLPFTTSTIQLPVH